MRTTPAKYIELIATGVVVTLIVFVAFVARMRCANKQQLSMSEQPTHSSEVRTKAKGNEYVAVIETNALLSSISVDRVCGFDPTAASCYDLRNDALRSIARHRDLPADDVAALMVYVAATDCVMRVEREAALKNDVLNLLRSQKRQPEGLADLLLEMVASKQYAPVVVDYCIQHLGAMAEKISDDAMRARIYASFVAAAKDVGETYSGTALYSLAEMPNKSKPESDELRRLTVAACGEGHEEERCGGVDGPSAGGEAGAQLAALYESNPRPPVVACAYPIGGVARRVVFW